MAARYPARAIAGTSASAVVRQAELEPVARRRFEQRTRVRRPARWCVGVLDRLSDLLEELLETRREKDLEVAAPSVADVAPPVQLSARCVHHCAGSATDLRVLAAERVLTLEDIEDFVLVRVDVR